MPLYKRKGEKENKERKRGGIHGEKKRASYSSERGLFPSRKMKTEQPHQTLKISKESTTVCNLSFIMMTMESCPVDHLRL
jgi:hypothetical protein